MSVVTNKSERRLGLLAVLVLLVAMWQAVGLGIARSDQVMTNIGLER